MKTVNVVRAYTSLTDIVDETLIEWPDGRVSPDRRIDSPFAPDWTGIERRTGYTDTEKLGVYHPPLQHFAPHALTSARRSTMAPGSEEERDAAARAPEGSGQNTGSQTEGVDPTAADPNTLESAGKAVDPGEGSETGASNSAQETQGATADDVARE